MNIYIYIYIYIYVCIYVYIHICIYMACVREGELRSVFAVYVSAHRAFFLFKYANGLKHESRERVCACVCAGGEKCLVLYAYHEIFLKGKNYKKRVAIGVKCKGRGVAIISRLLKKIGLFCTRAL